MITRRTRSATSVYCRPNPPGSHVGSRRGLDFGPATRLCALALAWSLASVSIGQTYTQPDGTEMELKPAQSDGATWLQDAQGYSVVEVPARHEYAMAVQIGGHLEVVDWDAARAAAPTESALHDPAKTSIAEFQAASGMTEGFDWYKRFQTTVPAGSDLTVTVVLITEKQTKDSRGAFVVVDSLDAEIEAQQP